MFDGVTGEPTDVMVNEGLEIYKKDGCDFLIALGGGSPIDSMKAISALAVTDQKITDFFGKEIEGNLPPTAAIPTTAGTGSEATPLHHHHGYRKGCEDAVERGRADAGPGDRGSSVHDHRAS